MGLLDIKAKIKSAIIGEGVSKIGSVIKDIADGVAQFVDTPEKKADLAKFMADKQQAAEAEENRHAEAVAELSYKETSAYLADTQSARNMQVEALKQDDKFAKRFIYYLAGGVIVLVFAFDFCMFKIKYPVENRDMINMIAGILNSTALVMILGFFFGNSKNSDDQAKQIKKMWDDTP